MPQFLINFEWHTDTKGYKIIAPAPRRRSKPIAHPIFGIPVEESLIESAPRLEERQRIVPLRRHAAALQATRDQ